MGLPSGDVIDHRKMKQKREALDISQADAASRAGLARKQAWYVIESGKQLNVTMETLYGIARALECDPRDLLVPPPSRRKGAKQ